MAKKTIKSCYIWDERLMAECDRLPAVAERASRVQSLIVSYSLINKLQVVHSTPALYEDLKLFHSEIYLEHLKTLQKVDDDYVIKINDEEFGIGYDCQPVSDMYQLVSVIAGGSVAAAKSIILGIADVAINWFGGWHHAQRFCAEGFCYVNDIVICIEKLRLRFKKVLYIDLDVHHGNGVQDAYNLSNSVFTLSIHKYEPGFYPGTGSVEEVGNLTGKGYTCNIPLHESYNDETMEYVFGKVFHKVYDSFKPEAIVVQCGADALAGDPMGGGGVTIKGYCTCVQNVLDKQKPTVLLGGGGYNYSNTAKLWASITALVVDVELDQNIPEHDYWPLYGPDYILSIQPLLARDKNCKADLDNCIAKIEDNLKFFIEGETIKQETDTEKQNQISTCKKFKETLYKRRKKLQIKENNVLINDESFNNDVYNFID
ncbi:unnamed protein product [Pieris brassicae]|uniref:Histone deacetylase n=1 Tax=Pieris brassicae TaxID=7116 RepID=A0A9P0TIF1_PIEBR|nr:unnamed protein product [Pieris brassicae]